MGMGKGLGTCLFFGLLASSVSWPRYGRPHPMYSRRQQTNENIFTNAVLLGLDFNDLQLLQAISGDVFGLGNLGLSNSGFPMNAYDRKRVKQDVNTLTALGVIDGPEEAGLYLSLIKNNRPDPQDNSSGRDVEGNIKRKTGKKNKVKDNGKSKVANKSKNVIRNAEAQQANFNRRDNAKLIQGRQGITQIKGRQGLVFKTKVNKAKLADITEKTTHVNKTKMSKQKIATKVVKAKRNIRRKGNNRGNNRKGRKGSVKRLKKSKTKRKGGESWERGDPGERETPLKARGKRISLRSSKSKGADVGRRKFFDRRLIVGRF